MCTPHVMGNGTLLISIQSTWARRDRTAIMSFPLLISFIFKTMMHFCVHLCAEHSLASRCAVGDSTQKQHSLYCTQQNEADDGRTIQHRRAIKPHRTASRSFRYNIDCEPHISGRSHTHTNTGAKCADLCPAICFARERELHNNNNNNTQCDRIAAHVEY